jgi:RNA recognition motif-containing protein
LFHFAIPQVTNNNLGYGFVQYRTPMQAQAGKAALNGIEIASRKVRIGWAQKNTTLFIGDLDGNVTTEELRTTFGQFGELVEDETFVKAGSGKFGFVRFKNRVDAEKAKKDMTRKVVGTRMVRIGWGDNHVQKHCVHVQFNPSSQTDKLDEDRILRTFMHFGPVDSVSLPRHANSSRLKGYCFVHFADTEEGERAAARAITDMADGRVDDVLVHSSYAKRHGNSFNASREKRPATSTNKGLQVPQQVHSSSRHSPHKHHQHNMTYQQHLASQSPYHQPMDPYSPMHQYAAHAHQYSGTQYYMPNPYAQPPYYSPPTNYATGAYVQAYTGGSPQLHHATPPMMAHGHQSNRFSSPLYVANSPPPGAMYSPAVHMGSPQVMPGGSMLPAMPSLGPSYMTAQAHYGE